VPFSWQKAIFAYLLQTGVTLWSNSVMWTHIDSLDSPYGFWMKLGLIGIIDLAGFWLVTLHLFGRAPLTRSYAIAAAILLMIVVLLHTGGVASYEGSKGENLAQLNAIGQNLTRMIEAETRAKAEANSKAAIEANARGQVRLASRLANSNPRTSSSEAQDKLSKMAEGQKIEGFLPTWYMNGMMYWLLMGLAAILSMISLLVTDKVGHIEDVDRNGVPDWMDRADRGRAAPAARRIREDPARFPCLPRSDCV
jgi:hypothetical protein